MKRSLVCLSLVIGIIFTSCKDDSSLTKNVNFDRTALLTHYATNVIPANYERLNLSVVNLNNAWASFKSDEQAGALLELQNALVLVYKNWQYCSIYELGPAEQVLLRANINTFPCDTFQIGSNIRTQNYNLGTASNLDAKGLPALDYLFFAKSNTNENISFLTDAKTQMYVDALLADLSDKVSFVNNAWTTGNYAAQFISKNGVDVGSSLGVLVNQLNFDYEIIKNPKVGIPLGKKSMGAILPEMTEAYYSGISKELILLNIQSTYNNFNGIDAAMNDGIGLDDYLRAVDAKHNGTALDVKINEQLMNAKAKVQALPANLSEAIKTNPTLVEEAYNEIQKAIIYMKTDMPSALGIMITYQDNDGD